MQFPEGMLRTTGSPSGVHRLLLQPEPGEGGVTGLLAEHCVWRRFAQSPGVTSSVVTWPSGLQSITFGAGFTEAYV